MLKEIKINTFKCFKEIELRSFKKVNIIFGKNNRGKTVFLEAISLLFSNTNPRQIFNLLRGMPVSFPLQREIWSILFYELDMTKTIKISGKVNELEAEVEICSSASQTFPSQTQSFYPENSLFLHWKYQGKDLKAYLTYNENFLKNFVPAFSFPIIPMSPALDPFIVHFSGNLKSPILETVFHTSLGRMDVQQVSQMFGELVRKNYKNLLVNLLSELDNSIKDIELMSFNGNSIVGVKIKDKFYPINQLGEGFYRIFVLSCLFVQRTNGIVLIDEIENGIHHSIQGMVWKWLLDMSERFNVQVFITTHSWEFIINALENTENFKELQGIRFETGNEKNQEIIPVVISGEELKEMVEQNYDVR
ncbi:MAG: AAA family ATPase [Desulfonauticus sp.]|nr:AAA family ATPase [Desulfonauticus sp.]